MEGTIKGSEDVYDSFNILLRRKPKENNFKAVLETIRDMMNTECVVPGRFIHPLPPPVDSHFTHPLTAL